MLNHSCRRFAARQTGLAQDLQGVIGFLKIRVVGHGSPAANLFKAGRSIRLLIRSKGLGLRLFEESEGAITNLSL
jgi:hypothetical protein